MAAENGNYGNYEVEMTNMSNSIEIKWENMGDLDLNNNIDDLCPEGPLELSLKITIKYFGKSKTIYLDRKGICLMTGAMKENYNITGITSDNTIEELNKFITNSKNYETLKTYFTETEKKKGGARRKKVGKAKKKNTKKKNARKRKVHTGPRGGKYVVVKGKKRYL